MYTRDKTKKVKVGSLELGGNNKVYIQSMTTTKTRNVLETLKQINSLIEEGCEIVRVSIITDEDVEGLKQLLKVVPIPIVADIHFDPNYAIKAINAGAHKIRLNPGNIKEEKLKEIVELAKTKNVPIRVGVNSGSLPKDLMEKYGVNEIAIVEAAKRYVNVLESYGFYDIVISLKASIPMLAIKSYMRAAEIFQYPLHLGITEAGSLKNGTIKSVAGLSPLLLNGIGNTIRISLSDDPVEEIKVAKRLLKSLDLYQNLPDVIACPTCGRLDFDLFPVVKEIEEYVKDLKAPLTISILGCVVNGPGEAKEADIGIAGAREKGVIFKKGKIYKTCHSSELVKELKILIDEWINNYYLENK